jgi:uncharacterized protein YqeY
MTAMKDCMKAGRKAELAVIRLIQAAIKQREVDERITLDDAQILSVLDKMLSQRRDSVRQFAAAGRQDLVDKENFEIQVIQGFMPQPLDDTAIEALLDAAIAAVNPTSIRDMSKVMAILKPQLQGRADMGQVGQLLKARLAALSD